MSFVTVLARMTHLLLSIALIVCAASFAVASLGFDLTEPNFKAATPTTRNAPGVLEWSLVQEGDENALYLLVQSDATNGQPKSQLITFSPVATIDEVVKKIAPIILPKATCSVMDPKDRVIDADNQLGELLKKHSHSHGGNDLSLSCQVKGKKVMHAHGHTSSTQIQTFPFRLFLKQPFHGNEIRARTELRNKILGTTREYPLESVELLGADWTGVLGFLEAFLKNHWGPMHSFPDYTTSKTQTGRWHLNTGAVLQADSTFGSESDAPIKIAVAADWAAGTRESDYVQDVMMNGNGTAFDPQWTLHIGDIYYIGAPEYVQSNCLGQIPSGAQKAVTWPHGSLGSFAVEGNHEAYDRSFGFFDVFLPTLGVTDQQTGQPMGQDAGFASMENAFWRIILLDTGYNTWSTNPFSDATNNTQPDSLMDWLVNVVNISDPTDTRGIIFFSHHQIATAFDTEEVSQATPNQIAAVLPAGRQVLWLYGHEHRMSWYKPKELPNNVIAYHRCIGNGGFPSDMEPIPHRANVTGLQAYDDRQYTIETGFWNTSVTYNGFVHMTLDQNSVSITYSTLASDPTSGELSPTLQTDLVQELFTVDDEGNVQLSNFAILDDQITIINQV